MTPPKTHSPGGADVAIMAGNQSLYGGEHIHNVLQEAFGALEPGGEVKVKQIFIRP